MKFVHIADMHFDAPFTSLDFKEDLGSRRRIEQRNVFKKVINYIKENNIDYLFIAGDLYEHEYMNLSTVSFIHNNFKEIPNTKIFITPGNHDPYIYNSYYSTYNFGDNVYIFSSPNIEKYEDENVNIYGMAFTEFYMEKSPLEDFSLPKSNKPNILIAHADLNGNKDAEGLSYNPILESKLNALNFDYVALGHIHKNNIDNFNRIYYPGSTISLGFDELGEHGMIVGELTKHNFSMNFVKLDDREFLEKDLNVSDCLAKEDIIEKIESLDLDENNLYKIVLVGKRNFDINTRDILKVINIENVLKIKNDTRLGFDLYELAKQNNLRGIFVKEVLKLQEKGVYTEEECIKAIEIGLSAM